MYICDYPDLWPEDEYDEFDMYDPRECILHDPRSSLPLLNSVEYERPLFTAIEIDCY